jgi:hypothetical protein
MKAQKWNYKTHKSEPYELPDGCRLYDENLTNYVSCCQCGKHERFGSMYTSKEIQDDLGFGYPVCKACFDIEIEKSK